MKKILAYLTNFWKYSLIGIVISLLSIFFSWILIDIVGFKAILASTIIGIIGFFIKYYGYVNIRLIKKKFVIFLVINLLYLIIYIISSAYLIDKLLIPTLIAMPIIIIFLFFIRFFAFYWTKIICD